MAPAVGKVGKAMDEEDGVFGSAAGGRGEQVGVGVAADGGRKALDPGVVWAELLGHDNLY